METIASLFNWHVDFLESELVKEISAMPVQFMHVLREWKTHHEFTHDEFAAFAGDFILRWL
jgi:hypothetical protein